MGVCFSHSITGSYAPGHHHSSLYPDRSSYLTHASMITAAGERGQVMDWPLKTPHITSALISLAKVSHTIMTNYKKNRKVPNYYWSERWKTGISVNLANDEHNSKGHYIMHHLNCHTSESEKN